jgi:hypothetical protein
MFRRVRGFFLLITLSPTRAPCLSALVEALEGRRLLAASVANASGIFAHGQEVTLTGSGFPFNVNAQTIWEDVESGGLNRAWGATSSLVPNRSDNRTPFSRFNAKANVTRSNTDGYFGAPGSMTGRHHYVDFWIKFSENWDWGTTGYGQGNQHLANIKMIRYWSQRSGVDENIYIAYAGWANSFISYGEYLPGTAKYTGGAREKLRRGDWHHITATLTESSARGVADGSLKFTVDGVVLQHRTNLITRADFSDFKRVSVIGIENAWGPGAGESNDAPNDVFLDEVYVSTTLAKVELGSASTYAASRHLQLQPSVTFASASSLRFTLNQGSLAPGSDVWIYVTDTSGNVNANGYRIRLLPGAPTARYGDANRDGAVNGADFAILAANFGRSGRAWEQGDFNGDGTVDGSDFSLMAANFGNGVTSNVEASVQAATTGLSATGTSVTSAPAPLPEPQSRSALAAPAVGATVTGPATPVGAPGRAVVATLPKDAAAPPIHSIRSLCRSLLAVAAALRRIA